MRRRDENCGVGCGASSVIATKGRETPRVVSAAANTILSTTDLRGLRIQLTADAAPALLVLLVDEQPTPSPSASLDRRSG